MFIAKNYLFSKYFWTCLYFERYLNFLYYRYITIHRNQMQFKSRQSFDNFSQKFMVIILLVALLPGIYKCQQGLMASLKLGKNVVLNANFSEPVVASSAYMYQGITGWNCLTHCEIKTCVKAQIFGEYCPNQVIQLNTDGNVHAILTQSVQLEADRHLLYMAYYNPRDFQDQKVIEVYLDNVLIYQFQPIAGTAKQLNIVEIIIYNYPGVHSLKLTQSGNLQRSGFTVSSLQLRKIEYSSEVLTYLEGVFKIQKMLIPGNRVSLSIFMGYFINLDRLEFYYYHFRNYSENSWFLISNVRKLQVTKDNLIRDTLVGTFPDQIQKAEAFMDSLDFKKNYTDPETLRKNQNGDSLLQNQRQFFLYNLPFIIITHTLLYILFQLLKRWPISLAFRKYYFLLIFFSLIFQGTIEQFTYYMTGELLLFCSFNFKHKLVNFLLLTFYFFVFLFGVFGFFWFKIVYKKKTYYFMDNHKIFVFGIQCAAIDRGVIAFLFGVIHRLFLYRPYEQLLALGIVEVTWLIFRIYYLKQKCFKSQAKMWIINLSCFLRITFQITFYLFETSQEQQIINTIHLGMIMVFFLLWAFELIFSFGQFFTQIKKIVSFCYAQQDNKQINQKARQCASKPQQKKKWTVTVIPPDEIGEPQQQKQPQKKSWILTVIHPDQIIEQSNHSQKKEENQKKKEIISSPTFSQEKKIKTTKEFQSKTSQNLKIKELKIL